MIGRNIEISVGAFSGVWGKISNIVFDDYYLVRLWDNAEHCIFIKDGDFKLLD